MSYPPNDGNGPVPMSERVVEVARYTKDSDQSKRRFEHYYQCPEHGVSHMPCSHWWEPRGFRSPHKPRIAAEPRRRQHKTHHNSRAFPL